MFDFKECYQRMQNLVLRNVLLIPLVLGICSCVRNQPQIIIVTSPSDIIVTPTVADPTLLTPDTAVFDILPTTEQIIETTATPIILSSVQDNTTEYIIQPGDTLSGIAAAQGISLEMLFSINSLENPDILTVGQVIKLPAPPSQATSEFKIIPDSQLVRAPGSNTFNVADFINQQPGYIRLAVDTVNDSLLTSSEVVQRVSLEYSVDARLLLALLEFKAKWLSENKLDNTAKVYPMEGQPSPLGFDRSGLYKQLAWAANQLNAGYYGWKNRAWTTLEFEEAVRLLYAPSLNAGTIGVQYFLSRNSSYLNWEQSVSPEGLYQTYIAYFGDPFMNAVDPLVPIGLSQPSLALPFASGQTWFFTGGWHGGWGSGSAWAAIDFAPPDDRPDGSELCYVSDYWATAVAPGMIARSGEGSVILDLDMDGDETTGWTILYLHMATDGRVPSGTIVQVGDPIGKPSCEGGFSSATHMHIARRYNGEWIPTSCDQCRPGFETPSLVLGDWTSYGLINQEYQGYMMNGTEQRTAEQGRLTPINRVSW
jgi:LysM repeat protein